MTTAGPSHASPRLRRPRFRLLALIRVLLVLGLCSLLSLWLLLRATRARAADVLVEIGQQLMQLPDAHYGGGVQQLWLNGLELQLQSGWSEQAPLEVVAQFRRACSSRAAIQLNDAERAAVAPLREGWFQSALDGVLLEDGEGGTAVVCIDPMGKPWDVLAMTEAARRFVSTGDLQELGRLRYALVRKADKGGSVFLTLWTDGSARLLEQFPRDRDAPGVDFPDVARVAGSQRFLSARLTDSVLAIYAHRVGTPEALAMQYREALVAGGYELLDKYARGKGSLSYGFEKGSRHVVLSLAEGNGVTLATLLSQP